MIFPRFAPSQAARLPSAPREEGSALVATTIVIAVAMALAAVLVTSYLTSEAEQVEDSLTQARVYWAMAGHLQYLRSRAEYGGLFGNGGKDTTKPVSDPTSLNALSACNNEDDGPPSTSATAPFVTVSGRTYDSRTGSLQEYLDAVSGKSVYGIQSSGAVGLVAVPGARTWYFPQQFFTGADAASNLLKFSVRGFVNPRQPAANKGEMRLDFDIPATGTAPAVQNLGTRFGRLTFGFCVVDQNGFDADGVTPKATAGNSGCKTPAIEGQSRVQFILRDHPLCYATSGGC